MREMQKLYYRRQGLRYSEQLIDPPVFQFEQLPKMAVWHYVPEDYRFPDVVAESSWFQGYQKKILLEIVSQYTKEQGPLRRPMFNLVEATRPWKRAHLQTWTLEPEAYVSNMNPETLIVINYGYLDIIYKYLPVKMAQYWRWENRQRTLYTKINEIAKKSDRNQYLFFPIPSIIQGRTILDKYAIEPPSNRTEDIFLQGGEAGFWQLDFWRWLLPEWRDRSLLGLIDPRYYGKINLIFQGTSGRQALINLAYIDAWIKGRPNITEVASLIQHPAKQIQIYFLKFMMALNALNVEEDTVGELILPEQTPTPQPARTTTVPPTAKEEPSEVDINAGEVDDVQYEDDIELPDEDEEDDLKAVGAAEVRVGVKTGLIDKTLVSEPEALPKQPDLTRALAKDIEADIAALDRINLVQLKNKGIKLDDSVPEPEIVSIDPKEVEAKIFTPKSPAERLRSRLDEDAEANLLTAAEYRKYNAQLQEYRESVDPYTEKGKRLEAMQIKPEELVLNPTLTAAKDTVSVPDKTMLSSSIKAYDKQYLKHVHRKDILQAIDAVQAAGVVVRRHEVDITHSALGSYENHVLELAPIDGKPSTVKFTLPVVDEEGVMVASSNRYVLRKQRVD